MSRIHDIVIEDFDCGHDDELDALRSQVEQQHKAAIRMSDANAAMSREVERYREVVTFALGVLRSSTMTWEQRGAVTYDALARLDADPPREPEA